MILREFTSQAFLNNVTNYPLRDHPRYGLGFRNGPVVRVYSYSLYWMVRHLGLTNVVSEVLRDGEPVIYGELSLEEIARLVGEGQLRRLRRHSWGICWPFKDQLNGDQDDFSGFNAWRERMLSQARCFQYQGDLLPEHASWLLS